MPAQGKQGNWPIGTSTAARRKDSAPRIKNGHESQLARKTFRGQINHAPEQVDSASPVAGLAPAVNYIGDLTADGTLKDSAGTGWVVQNTGVQAFVLGSLGGVNYVWDQRRRAGRGPRSLPGR
jgi:hypothetical protein